MKKENLHQPFSVFYVTTDECPKAEHQHSFFELVYIISGTGKQCINQNHFDYRAGHLFLITPEDCHSFEVHTTTTFFFLRFNDIYIRESGISTGNIQRLEYILHHANHKPGCILKHTLDKDVVRALADATISEHETRDLYHNELVQQYVNTLIVLVARNIAKYQQLEIGEQSEQKAADILNFIQANIYHPKKLRADFLCKYFNVSVNYLGKYFKQHTGSTIQKYITKYRQTLIEHRLLHSDKRLNEIVHEFGFTDESHLNKFFRNNRGMSPTLFKTAHIHKQTAQSAV